MKTGLVLEGGAMRGLFTAGVIDVFMENGIDFDGAIGVSAGACFGVNIKSKQIGRVLRYNKKYSRDKRYCSISSLIKTGNIYGTEMCYYDIPYKYDVFDFDTYNNNPMEFYCVCTDVKTGMPIYHSCPVADKGLMEWLRASASMPLVSEIVEIDGYKMLDGGISDSIPLRFFETAGYTHSVVVLTQPADYLKKKNSLLPLMKLMLKKYPKLIEALANRHNMYNETLEYIKEKEKRGDILVIRPEKSLDIKRTEKNPDELQRVYDIGRQVALSRLDEIKAFVTA